MRQLLTMTATETAIESLRARSIAPIRAAGVILGLSGLAAVGSLFFLWLGATTVDPPGTEYGPSFGYIIFAIGLSVIWWVVAFIGFVVLWLARPRSVFSLPFLLVALGFAGIAGQVATNEPLRDALAFLSLGLLTVGTVTGVAVLVLRRPFGLIANILLAVLLLCLAYDAIVGFGAVGSRERTSTGYGPSVIVGCILLLPAIALVVRPRTRSTATG